jgi:hypothetical protein
MLIIFPPCGGSLAPAEAVYDVLRQDGRRFLPNQDISLATLTYPSPEASQLKNFLPALKFVKPTKQYPWMAASKVLHFANPGLFPIWDWEIIWGKVMGTGQGGQPGAFHSEYRSFCRQRGFSVSENGSVFLLYYVLWAASAIHKMDRDFMQWFLIWMHQRFSVDMRKYGVKENLAGYYAVAFEFVAIGAALFELGE